MTNGKSEQGITLIEVGLAMMIVAVLSIGVSAVVKAGVETQMSNRMNQHMQTISNLIVSDLRMDFREVDTVTITGGGNQMTLATPNGNVVYRLAGGNLTRTSPAGRVKTYNDPALYNNNLEIICPGGQALPGGPAVNGCFAPVNVNSYGLPRQVVMPQMAVRQKLSSNTLIDRHFGAPNFTLRNFAFDVMAATEFQ